MAKVAVVVDVVAVMVAVVVVVAMAEEQDATSVVSIAEKIISLAIVLVAKLSLIQMVVLLLPITLNVRNASHWLLGNMFVWPIFAKSLQMTLDNSGSIVPIANAAQLGSLVSISCPILTLIMIQIFSDLLEIIPRLLILIQYHLDHWMSPNMSPPMSHLTQMNYNLMGSGAHQSTILSKRNNL